MALTELREWEDAPPAPQMFGNAGREHMERFGSEPDHFAWIGWKNHKHSVNNPYAQFQDEYTLDEIREAQGDLRAADEAAVLAHLRRQRRARRGLRALRRQHGLWDRAVEILGQALVTDLSSTFESRSRDRGRGRRHEPVAAERALAEAGREVAEVDVVELHDCFSANELITYEALGLAAEGEGHKLVEAQATTYGGDGPVVNPSGGLISKGHPLGATGLAQCSELTWQLRGDAEGRQVAGRGPRAAAQHRARRRRRRDRLQAGRVMRRRPLRQSKRHG